MLRLFNLTTMIKKNDDIAIIRPATVKDVPQIAYVAKETFRKTYVDEDNVPVFSEKDLEKVESDILTTYPELITNINHHITVGEVNNKVVAFARTDKLGDTAFLDKLYVLPEFQAKKLGVSLFKNSLEHAHSAWHVNRMRIDVSNGNKRAKDFYGKNGFYVIGTHYKETSNGKKSSGSDLLCDDIQTSLFNLKKYTSSSSSGPKLSS